MLEIKTTNNKMWHFSTEEIIKLQNRMNDIWETNPDDKMDYFAATNRLLGMIDGLLTPEHYY